MPSDDQNSTLFILSAGGMGDLVLLAGFIHSVSGSRPRPRIVLACRDPFVELPKLFPSPPDEVVPAGLHPYQHDAPSGELSAALHQWRSRCGAYPGCVFLSAEYRPTWLSWLTSSFLRPTESWMSFPMAPPRGLLTVLAQEFPFTLPAFRTPESPDYDHETKRYAGLASALGFRPQSFPVWKLTLEATVETQLLLRDWNTGAQEYLLAFPVPDRHLAVKGWPLELFQELLRLAAAEFGIPIVLTGESSQSAELESFAAALRSKGAAVHVFAGGPRDLPVLAGLAAQARAYVGNDTGTAHLAQAYGTPGTIVFGGGAWPVYSPWRPGSTALVYELPCFGCDYDCLFDFGVCVDSIRLEWVWEDLRKSILSPPAAPRIHRCKTDPAVLLPHIPRAVAHCRDLRRHVNEGTPEIVEAHHAAGRRLQQLTELSAEAEKRRQQLTEMSVEAEKRRQLLIQSHQSGEEMREIIRRLERQIRDLNQRGRGAN